MSRQQLQKEPFKYGWKELFLYWGVASLLTTIITKIFSPLAIYLREILIAGIAITACVYIKNLHKAIDTTLEQHALDMKNYQAKLEDVEGKHTALANEFSKKSKSLDRSERNEQYLYSSISAIAHTDKKADRISKFNALISILKENNNG